VVASCLGSLPCHIFVLIIQKTLRPMGFQRLTGIMNCPGALAWKIGKPAGDISKTINSSWHQHAPLRNLIKCVSTYAMLQVR
jgi:hypothetical protein